MDNDDYAANDDVVDADGDGSGDQSFDVIQSI